MQGLPSQYKTIHYNPSISTLGDVHHEHAGPRVLITNNLPDEYRLAAARRFPAPILLEYLVTVSALIVADL